MTQATATLFGKLGGKTAIEAVVKEFYKRVLADAELKGFFEQTDMDHQTVQQIKFISMALGGPNEYNGRSMKEAHSTLGITEFHFDLVAGHLVEALRSLGVPEADVDEVVATVAPLKAEIVAV